MTTTSDMARLLMMQGTALPDAGLGPVTNTTRAGRPNPMLTAPPNQERPADYMHPVAELLSLPMGAYGAGQLVGSGVNAMRDEDYASGAGQIALGMAGMLPMALKGAKPKPQGIRAFHGSPHNYKAERLIEWPDGRTEYIEGMPDVLPDIPTGAKVLKDFPLGRQRLDKIGSGEGAQAFGYGLYEAEAEGTAQTYKTALAGKVLDPKDVAARHDLPEAVSSDLYNAIHHGNDDPLEAAKAVQMKNSALRDDGSIMNVGPKRRQIAQAIEDGRSLAKGHMYEVNIRANPEDFLDWDKPLSQQSEKVREAALSAMERSSGGITRNDLKEGVTGADAVRYGGLDDPNAMTKALREAGIPGIRYLDQMSRGVGKGSSNYVVFDDALVEILRKYGLLGPVAGGGTLAGMLMGGQEGETY